MNKPQPQPLPVMALLPSDKTLREVNEALGLPTDSETIGDKAQEMRMAFGTLAMKLFDQRDHRYQMVHKEPMGYHLQQETVHQCEMQALDIITDQYVRKPMRPIWAQEDETEYETEIW